MAVVPRQNTTEEGFLESGTLIFYRREIPKAGCALGNDTLGSRSPFPIRAMAEQASVNTPVGPALPVRPFLVPSLLGGCCSSFCTPAGSRAWERWAATLPGRGPESRQLPRRSRCAADADLQEP